MNRRNATTLYLLLALLLSLEALLLGCGRPEDTAAQPPAAPVTYAAPASNFGHLSPIRLPEGEWFDGFFIEAGTNSGAHISERQTNYFFATTTNPRAFSPGVHTLRNAQGVPVLIVVDSLF